MARRGSRFLAGRASNPLAARFREIERAIRRRQRFNTAEVTTIVNNAISGGGGGGGGSAANTLIVDDEGIQQGVAERMDFVGGGVTATVVGSTATIEVPCPCECDEEFVLDGGFWQTPDDASLDILGDIDLRGAVALNDWTPAIANAVVSKFDVGGGQESYELAVLSSGLLQMSWSTDGSTQVNKSSTVAPTVSDGVSLAVRATLDVNNGAAGNTVTFYTKSTTPSTALADIESDSGWTQLGSAVVTAGTTSIFNGTAVLAVGARSSNSLLLMGALHAVVVKDGINGTTVADPDFAAQPSGTDSFSDDSGNPWTLEDQSAIPVGCLGQSAVYDEGAFQGTVKEFDFVGSSVSAAVSGDRATVTVGGAGAGYALVGFTYIAQGTTTYTVPAGIDAILVECIGAGGGGGGAGTAAVSGASGGGGAGGGYAQTFIEGPLDATYACVVGAGGAGGAAGNNVGSGGSDTTFDSPSVCTATGGAGGTGMAAGTAFASQGGSVAGAGTVGDLLLTGGDGMTGILLSGTMGIPGQGGSAARGGGGVRGRTSTGNGLAGASFGGGGSGGNVESGTAAAAGGNGADGRIIVWEYAAV